jgi:hypothetical protein
MSEISKSRFEEDGVVLLKNVWEKNAVTRLMQDYDKLDKEIKNKC